MFIMQPLATGRFVVYQWKSDGSTAKKFTLT